MTVTNNLFRTTLYSGILNLSGHEIDRIVELGHVCDTEKAQTSVWFLIKAAFTPFKSNRLQTLVEWWKQFGGAQAISQEFLATVTCELEPEYSTTSITEMVKRFQRNGFHDLPLIYKLLLLFIPIRASELYFTPTLERLHIITLQCLSIPTTLFLLCYVAFATWPRLVMLKLSDEEWRLYDGLSHMEARTMGRTKGGRLALVPDGTLVGDIIAVCKGGRVPLVLRSASTRESFQIVGESYVYGVMDGKEGFDESERRRFAIV
jgi:hypothetical protein